MSATPEVEAPGWDDLRLLLAIARAGSFLGAGRALGAATSTVARRTSALERRLDRALVERGPAGVRLTHAAAALVTIAERFEAELAAALRDLPGADGSLSGALRITAGDGFLGAMVELAREFAGRHPRCTYEISVESRITDVARREADVALRTVHLQEASLIYRRLGVLPFGLYAAPAYVDEAGTPATADELADHRIVGLGPPLDRLPTIRWLKKICRTSWAVAGSSFTAQLEATRAGLGISVLPRARAQGLIEVLPGICPEPVPVYLVTHPQALRQPHIRAFVDFAVPRLRAELTEA